MRCNLYEIVEKFIAMVNLADEYIEVNLPYMQGGVKKSILLSGSPGNTATDVIGCLMQKQPDLVAEILYYETKGLDMTLDVEREHHNKDIRQILDLLKITLATNKTPAPGPRNEDNLAMVREHIVAVDEELRRRDKKITELEQELGHSQQSKQNIINVGFHRIKLLEEEAKRLKEELDKKDKQAADDLAKIAELQAKHQPGIDYNEALHDMNRKKEDLEMSLDAAERKIAELEARNAELEKAVKGIKYAMTAEQDMLHE